VVTVQLVFSRCFLKPNSRPSFVRTSRDVTPDDSGIEWLQLVVWLEPTVRSTPKVVSADATRAPAETEKLADVVTEMSPRSDRPGE